MGKNLESVILKAIDMHYVDFDKKKIRSISHVNDEVIVVIVSDEREKSFSNLKRIVRGYDKFITITDKDTIVFASPIEDGMERTETKLLDAMAKVGTNVIELSKKKYLSHHAFSEGLMLMLDLMKTKYYMPVIGELVLKDRELLSDNCIVIITATIDKMTKEVLAGLEVVTMGFIYVKDNIYLIKEAQRLASDVIKQNTKTKYVDFSKIKFDIRDKVDKYFYEETECKPIILIVIGEV